MLEHFKNEAKNLKGIKLDEFEEFPNTFFDRIKEKWSFNEVRKFSHSIFSSSYLLLSKTACLVNGVQELGKSWYSIYDKYKSNFKCARNPNDLALKYSNLEKNIEVLDYFKNGSKLFQ
jgi:hypothetical protein